MKSNTNYTNHCPNNGISTKNKLWIAYAVNIHFDTSTGVSPIGIGRIKFLFWLIENRKTLSCASTFRGICSLSGFSYTTVYHTISFLEDVGLANKIHDRSEKKLSESMCSIPSYENIDKLGSEMKKFLLWLYDAICSVIKSSGTTGKKQLFFLKWLYENRHKLEQGHRALSYAVDISPMTVYRTLKMLEEAGLVRITKNGSKVGDTIEVIEYRSIK